MYGYTAKYENVLIRAATGTIEQPLAFSAAA